MKHRVSLGKCRELLAPDLVCILGDKKVSERVSSVRESPHPVSVSGFFSHVSVNLRIPKVTIIMDTLFPTVTERTTAHLDHSAPR